ncbi:ATP-dependent zinc metalloprotease FtsH-like [Schistocerca gregaria]|uniref:ATP-dependent zinc metalloprotease FtsH-like n=1 Tax=Schistocerca gregaria TaxID=7010 RepID=UPI00211ED4F8|nr:ATP-dependent zinc metalloprotease FtsH-like [Schistocerca gregaria]
MLFTKAYQKCGTRKPPYSINRLSDVVPHRSRGGRLVLRSPSLSFVRFISVSKSRFVVQDFKAWLKNNPVLNDGYSVTHAFSENKKSNKSHEDNTEKTAKTDNTAEKHGHSPNSPSNGDSNPPANINILMFVATTFACIFTYSAWRASLSNTVSETEIDFFIFRTKFLEGHRVQKLVIVNDIAHIFTNSAIPAYYMRIGHPDSFERRLRQAEIECNIKEEDFVPVVYKYPGRFWSTVRSIIPTVLIIGLSVALWRSTRAPGNNIFDPPGTTARRSSLITAETKPKVRFSDVAGLEDAKDEVVEFVSFLKHPEKFTRLGGRIPKGALLTGLPGTGKTLLAKATAGEAGVPFFSTSGSDFVEMYVGVGPMRIRQLFGQARKKAPCIIFIDEIDAVGRSRTSTFHNDERENTLNQLLVEMDGFSSTSNIIVIAGTNRVDVLDKALLRPGRFDRIINIDAPTRAGRIDIFRVHLKPIKLAVPAEEVVERLADLTVGFVGADIASVCNEGALIAARKNKDSVEIEDLEAAIERIIGGLERKTKVLQAGEKNTIAYHESGHAIIGWILEHTNPLLKVSIVPRGTAALGYSQYQKQERYLTSELEMLDNMCMILGGRAAESIVFNQLSTGAQDDLNKVTNMAHEMLTRYGFSKVIGLVSFKPNTSEAPYSHRLYSDDTSRLIDEEVRRLVSSAYERAVELLKSRRDKLDSLAQLLLKKEVISSADMVEILGERPFPSPNSSTSGFKTENK